MAVRRIITTSAVAVALITSAMSTAAAQSAANFYKDKQVTMVIPAGSGGSYGRYGRLGKAALEKFMPGTTIVMQYMPGSGGVKATNYVSSAAAKDGSVIMGISGTAAQTQLFRPDRVHFDVRIIPFIGQYTPLPSIISVWHEAPANPATRGGGGRKEIEKNIPCVLRTFPYSIARNTTHLAAVYICPVHSIMESWR